MCFTATVLLSGLWLESVTNIVNSHRRSGLRFLHDILKTQNRVKLDESRVKQPEEL
jgi:hypothetical protein